MTIGFLTCRTVGGITPDDAMIADALAERGATVRAVSWDESAPPDDLDALVIRSPWNYHLEPDAFLTWIDRAARFSPVYDDPAIIRWNAHKGYLFELQRAGVPVAPTVLCKKDGSGDLQAIMRERDWAQVVVKPAISASSYMTTIVGAHAYAMHGTGALHGRVVEDGQHLLDDILQTRDALIQPFMPEILERGERSLVFLDGEFSHAVQKAPFTSAPGGGKPVRPEEDELEIAQLALSVLPDVPLFARVDLLRAPDGSDRLMELELIDPELYMRFAGDAPAKFAHALLRRL